MEEWDTCNEVDLLRLEKLLRAATQHNELRDLL